MTVVDRAKEPEPARAAAAPVQDEIASHPDAVQLLAAIEARPDDEAPQLVLADLLLSAEDPRGELIVLDHREQAPGGLSDPDALERYLLLAAEYSFPRALPEEPPLLDFTHQSSNPLAYIVFHAGRRFDVRYRTYQLTVTVDGVNPPASWRLDLEAHTWTTDETIAILRILSDAIRASSPLRPLRFPFIRHPPPIYDGGPLRCYRLPRDFTEPRGIAPDRYGLAARDYERWMTLWRRLARLRKAALHQQV